MTKLNIRWSAYVPTDVDAVQKPSGDWEFPGMMGNSVDDIYSFFHRYFNVTSIYLSLNNEECLKKVKNNLSDLVTIYLPVSDDADEYVVPSPVMSRRIVIGSGYNYTKYRENLKHRIVGTALENFASFSLYIYLAFSFIIASIIATIFAERILKQRCRRRRRTRWQIIFKTICKSLDQSRQRLNKWIQLSVLMTIFIFTSFFSFAFQSQQLISDPPKIIRSLEEMVKRPNCTPIFFNMLFDDSDLFKNSPPGSMRQKVWQKGLSLGNESKFVKSTIDDFSSGMNLLMDISVSISKLNMLLITTDFTSTWLSKVVCSFSKGDEYFVALIQNEQTEQNEELMGFALRRDYERLSALIAFERILVEYGLLTHWRDSLYVEYGHEINNPSKQHIAKQFIICSINSISQDANNKIIYPNLRFIQSFLLLMFSLYVISGCVLLGEITYKRLKHSIQLE